MATSSIFADFSIKDVNTLENFARALEESEAAEARAPQQTHERARQLTDANEIRAIFAKARALR